MEPDEGLSLGDRRGSPRGLSGRLHVSGDRDGSRRRRRPSAVHGSPDGDAHRHLGITLGEWTSFMDDLHQSPTRFQAPQPKRPELDAIAETSQDAIVVASLQER
jgi:hypothetical protein